MVKNKAFQRSYENEPDAEEADLQTALTPNMHAEIGTKLS